MFDEQAYVLQIKDNNAYVIGTKYLTPLEIILRKGIDSETKVGEKLYIGKEKREKVYSIRKKLDPEDLKKIDELDVIPILEKIIDENESFYVNFINNSKSASIKRHQLQLLPNIGEKAFQKIISERENKFFESLEDLENRADINIRKSIAKRIFDELTAPDKYYLFVKNPKLIK